MRTSFLTRHRRAARAMLCALAIICPLDATGAQPSPALHRRDVRADDGHSLVLWEKTPAKNVRGEIVLLHGRTWSALPNFDLHVKGQHVSLMDALVAEGYAVYALDQRGYGATGRDTTGWLTPDRAAMDAAAVADWVAARALRGRRPTLLGYSRGSATAMLAAQRHPEKLSALIMYAPYYNVVRPPHILETAGPPPRARTTRAGAAEDFLTPASTPDGVKDAYVEQSTTSDSVRVDWRHEEQFSVLDPGAVHIPTLVIFGERDPYASAAEIPVFFSRLATIDRWWVVLASADHVAHLERQAAFVRALVSFLQR